MFSALYHQDNMDAQPRWSHQQYVCLLSRTDQLLTAKIETERHWKRSIFNLTVKFIVRVSLSFQLLTFGKLWFLSNFDHLYTFIYVYKWSKLSNYEIILVELADPGDGLKCAVWRMFCTAQSINSLPGKHLTMNSSLRITRRWYSQGNSSRCSSKESRWG